MDSLFLTALLCSVIHWPRVLSISPTYTVPHSHGIEYATPLQKRVLSKKNLENERKNLQEGLKASGYPPALALKGLFKHSQRNIQITRTWNKTYYASLTSEV